MTVSTTTFFVDALGNDVTTVFNYDFIPDSAATMEVFYIDASDPPVTTLLSPSEYTLYINPVPVGGLWGIGGTVTYPLAGPAIATGTKLRIQRDVPYLQTVSILNQGAFYPKAVEQALDLLEMQIQQLQGGGSGGSSGGTDTEAIIAFEFLGGVPPVTEEVIGLTSFPQEVSFSENFEGATGHTEVNPTATFTASIAHNDVQVGSMSISTSGVFTFTTLMCPDLVYAVGDWLSIIAPVGVDSTLADFSWTFKGVKN